MRGTEDAAAAESDEGQGPDQASSPRPLDPAPVLPEYDGGAGGDYAPTSPGYLDVAGDHSEPGEPGRHEGRGPTESAPRALPPLPPPVTAGAPLPAPPLGPPPLGPPPLGSLPSKAISRESFSSSAAEPSFAPSSAAGPSGTQWRATDASAGDQRPWGVPDPSSSPSYPQESGPVLDGRWVGQGHGPAVQAPPHPRPGPPSRPSGLFGPAPSKRAPHRWGLGAYLLVEAVFLLVSVGLGYLLGRSITTSAAAVALALSVPTVCAAGLAVLITRLRGNGPRIDLGLRLTGRDVAVGVACGLAGLVVTIPASVLYVAIVGADATSAVGDALGGLRAGPVLAVTIFVIVVFVAPLCEEIVYRGLLWGAVERLGANRWWALVVTTIVFALAHFEFTRTPLLLVVAIPIGIARVITGQLTAGVIAHQINNLLPGIVLMLGVLGLVPMT